MPNICKWLLPPLLLLALLHTTGCGHSVLVETDRIGLNLRIPIGEVNAVSFTIGSDKEVVAVMRGGASMETTTSAGGGLLSAQAAANKITVFRANMQFNEGNLKDVLCSPDVPDEAKVELAKAIAPAAKAPKFPDSIVSTRDATMQVGALAVTTNAVNLAKFGKTGVDLIVDKVTDSVTSITTQTVDTVSDVVHDAVNPLEGTVEEIQGTVDAIDRTITNTMNQVDASVTNALNRVDQSVTNAVHAVNETISDSLFKANETAKDIVLLIALVILIFALVALLVSLRKTNKQIKEKTTRASDVWTTKTGMYPVTDIANDPSPLDGTGDTEPKESITPKLSWWQKLTKWIVNAALFLVQLIKMVPPEYRKQAIQYLIELWKQHNEEKRLKKLAKQKK